MPRYRPALSLLAVLVMMVFPGCDDTPDIDASALPTINAQTIRDALYELREAHQPEGENGWPYLEQAFAAINDVMAQYPKPEYEKRQHYDRGKLDFQRVLDGEDDIARELEALTLILESDALDLLDQALACPRLVRPIPEDEILMLRDGVYAHSNALHNFNAVLQILLEKAIDQRDIPQVMLQFQRLLMLAERWNRQPLSMIDHMVGNGIHATALEPIRKAAPSHVFDVESLRSLLELIEPIDRASFLRGVRIEQYAMYDMIDKLYTCDERGEGHIDADKLLALGDMVANGSGDTVTARLFASRLETIDRIEAYFAPILADVQFARPDRTSSFDIRAFHKDLDHPKWELLNIILSAVHTMDSQMDTKEMGIAQTRIMLALEIHHHEHGEYPESLNALVPHILSELPVDPFSNAKEPFGYRRLNDHPRGWEYELWSTGANGVNNGGIYHMPQVFDALRDEDLDADFPLYPSREQLDPRH